MVSVRRVVPILLVSVALPVIGAGQQSSPMVTTTQAAPTSLAGSSKPVSKATKSTAPAAAPVDRITPPQRATTRVAKKSTHPPRQLHRVGSHWTAYNPPDMTTFPATAHTYTIVRGDTLWALAKRFYGNAYLWPQLWESNTYITDAHWIYPGDPLLIEGEGGGPSTQSASSTAGTVTTSGDGNTASMSADVATAASLGPPVPLASDADIYCYGYLGDPEEVLPNRIHSFEDVELKYIPGATKQENGVSVGDVIYIEGGTSTGILAGDTYMVVKPQELVYLPKETSRSSKNGRTITGRHYDYRGQVRILCATDKLATAVVSQSCSDIQVGDRLKPLPSIPIPLARMGPMPTVCDPSSGKKAGFIVNSRDYTYSLGEGSLVEINLGQEDQLQAGDFLTVFRDSTVSGTPRQLLGEIAVLTTEPHTATAKVLQMRYHMQVGDRIEVK